MKTFAEFQVLGRIGKVRELGQTTRVSICANYAFKDRNGETKDKPYWNEITIWSESARKYVRDYAKPGDLVVARGTLKQGSFSRRKARRSTPSISTATISRFSPRCGRRCIFGGARGSAGARRHPEGLVTREKR